MEKVEEYFNLEEIEIVRDEEMEGDKEIENTVAKDVKITEEIEVAEEVKSVEVTTDIQEVRLPNDDIEITAEEQAPNQPEKPVEAPESRDTDIDMKDDSVQDVVMVLESGQKESDAVLDSATAGADMDLVENVEAKE
jgi:hypothetical protein